MGDSTKYRPLARCVYELIFKVNKQLHHMSQEMMYILWKFESNTILHYLAFNHSNVVATCRFYLQTQNTLGNFILEAFLLSLFPPFFF